MCKVDSSWDMAVWPKELSSGLCDDPGAGMRGGGGREGMYICLKLIHVLVQQKLIHHSKADILQFKKIN